MSDACEAILASTRALYSQHDVTPTLRIDSVLDPHRVDMVTLGQIESLRPFGMDFSAPLFLLENISAPILPLGQTGEHIRWDMP